MDNCVLYIKRVYLLHPKITKFHVGNVGLLMWWVEVKNSEWQIQNPNSDKFSLNFAHFDYFSVTNLEWTF